MNDQEISKNRSPVHAESDVVAFSNAVRLTGREWSVVGIVTVLLVLFAPSLWKRLEKFSLETDYRIPHELGNDYWLYERYAGLAAERYDTLLIGDSVVWGAYVTRRETLSHYLNDLAGTEYFANLGLEGAHPLALTGLLEHYAGSVRGKIVLLHCNPLWMSSPQADLQDEKSPIRNHPRLVSQFVPGIPGYKEEISRRIGVVVEQHVPISSWTTHLQQAYYQQTDIPSWTLEHPYANPLKPLTNGLPSADEPLLHEPLPWDHKKRGKHSDLQQDYPWIDMDRSLQWHAFQRAVKTLRQRDNRVFVLVGPFNEHLLKAESLPRYNKVKETIADWLEQEQIPHYLPPPLPSEHYGDASHPLAAGYMELARQLRDQPFFRP